MSYDLKDVEQTKTQLCSARISTAAAQQYPFVLNFNSIGFQPDFMIVRNICIDSGAGDFEGLFSIWSDLANDYIGVFTGSAVFSSNPMSVFSIKKPIQQAGFDIKQLNAQNQWVSPTGMNGEIVDLSLTLEFVKLNRYKFGDRISKD